MFFPRGGSSHVVRSLARALPAHGWDVTVVSGSLAGAGEAPKFFGDLRTRWLDFTPAARSEDPMAHDPPMHPSYEDRPDAPDAVFAKLDDDAFEHQTRAWCRMLEEAGAAEQDVLHLHHLTPLHEAAKRVAPDVPVVGHLHGTELLMLEAIARGDRDWPHGGAWSERMRGWARRCRRVVLLSEGQRERAAETLDIEPERCFVLPNGFDPETFRPREVDREAHWRRHLVDEPQGWRPGGEAGSVAYAPEDLEALAGPTVLYVGRFTEVKRLPVLIRAWAQREEEGALVLLGGHPGEWEGEHPLEVVEATGARNVFLAGWHDHEELPAFLGAADVLVLPSVREQFGQVIVEAMACEVAPIAVDRYGPADIVEDGETGWLVPPDDPEELARALTEALGDDDERARRAENAARVAHERYAWPSLAGRLAGVFEEVAGG